MAVRTRFLTFNDLERMRETRTDRLELIEGELYVTPSPTPMHQFVSGRLFFWFKQTVLRLGYGLVFDAPLDVHLAEKTIVQPELIFILPDRRPTVTAGKMEGAPSLAVEILSPSTRAYDRTTNCRATAWSAAQSRHRRGWPGPSFTSAVRHRARRAVCVAT